MTKSTTDTDSGDFLVVSANAMRRTHCDTMAEGINHAEHLLRNGESCTKLYVVQIVAEVERSGWKCNRRQDIANVTVQTREDAVKSRWIKRVEEAQKKLHDAIVNLVALKKCPYKFQHTHTEYCFKTRPSVDDFFNRNQ